MKKSTMLFTVFSICVIFLPPVLAYAGVGSWVSQLKIEAGEQAIGWIVAAIFSILSLTLGAWVLKWKTATKEAIDVIIAIGKARKTASPGGKVITKEELDGILAECTQAGSALATAWQTRKDELKTP